MPPSKGNPPETNTKMNTKYSYWIESVRTNDGSTPPETNTKMNSKKYDAALKASRIAQCAYNVAAQMYRNREIGDATFLAARDAYRLSGAAFDKAFNDEVSESQVEASID